MTLITNSDVDENAGIATSKLAHDGSDAGSSPVTVFQIMNQTPNFLNYVGGSISSDPSVNHAAINSLFSDMASRGRSECKFPAGEIPISGTISLSGAGIRVCGAGDNQTILIFNAVSSDGMVVSGTNCTVEGIGSIAPNSTSKSVFKVTGQNPNLSSITVLAGANAMEFTGNTGGVHLNGIRLYNFLNRGFWAHDSVQGISLVNAEIIAGSHSNGSIGCIVLENFSSAVRMSNVETLQGVRSILCNAVVPCGDVTSPAYSTFESCYFDDAAQGSIISGSKLMSFGSCWFSGGRSGAGYPSATLAANNDVTFTGARFSLGGSVNVQHNGDNKGIKFIGCTASDSGYVTHQGRGISFEQGSHNFQVIGGRFTNGVYSGGYQSFGIVADRCTRYSIIGADVDGNTVQGLYEYMPPSTGRTILGNY